MMKTIRCMIEHQAWANRELLNAVRASGADNRDALKLFRHLLMAEQVWLSRLNGGGITRFSLWSDDAGLDEIEAMIEINESQYATYLSGLKEERLDEVLTYANQSGKVFRQKIRDILVHVALHGQYHRGQVNRALREASGEPASLDYILYARNRSEETQ